MFRFVTALAVALLCQAMLRATSIEPVSFDDLVTRADVIFVGDVVDVHPFPVDTPDGRAIKTRVAFSVVDPIAGTRGLVEVFDFLGGEIDGVALEISGMPKFSVGQRRVVFARRDGSINPIVGFTQGLMQVVHDVNGVERVLTLDGRAIGDVDAIGKEQAATNRLLLPMRLSDFRYRIVRARAQVKR